MKKLPVNPFKVPRLNMPMGMAMHPVYPERMESIATEAREKKVAFRREKTKDIPGDVEVGKRPRMHKRF
jgi:hypothetical protein